ncbi:hypothetical protein TWF730_005426 [Orbilia blumenaviensis]|uniref:Uncharacterized protein n=1 Tax=Orbilia blumenaviensis TaxID=1796055 RepID=A0AAV9VLM1_9PEZI
MPTPLTILTLLLSTTTFLPLTTAYYHLATRSKRNEWFGNYVSYASGSRIADSKVDKCQLYTNTKDKGGVNAITIYNQPGLGTSAAIFAFYDDTVCGATKGKPGGRGGGSWKANNPKAKPVYVAVLDKPLPGDEEGEDYYDLDSLDGVWLINLFQALGREPTFRTMKALDYLKEIEPGGLLEGTEDDPAQVIYKWNKYGNREPQYITGSVVKLEEPGAITEQLTTSSNMYMALRDLTERGLRPGSENIPNPLPEYFRKVIAGEVAEGLTALYLGEDIDSPTTIRNRKLEMRRRSKKQRAEDPQGLRNLISSIARDQENGEEYELSELSDLSESELSDIHAQVRLEKFLQTSEANDDDIGEALDQISLQQDVPGEEEVLIQEAVPIQEESPIKEDVLTQENQDAIEGGGDLYIEIMDPSAYNFNDRPPTRGGPPADDETPDDQRLVKAPPRDDTDSRESSNAARARAFQRFMSESTQIKPEANQDSMQEEQPPVKTEWELGAPSRFYPVRIQRGDKCVVSLVQTQEGESTAANQVEQNNQANPENCIVISSDASAVGEPQAGGDGMRVEEGEVEGGREPVGMEEEPLAESSIAANQDDIQLESPDIIDAIQEEEGDPVIPQLEINSPEVNPPEINSPQPRRENPPVDPLTNAISPPITWDSRISGSGNSRIRELLNIDPDYFTPRSSTSTGRRAPARALPPASFNDIENPPSVAVSNQNDRAALENLIEMEDQIEGHEGSFDNYESFVSGRRRNSGN